MPAVKISADYVATSRRLCRSTVRKGSAFPAGTPLLIRGCASNFGGAAANQQGKRDGKPEAYRSVLRQSRAEPS
jgi:hypothetical protein